VKKALKKLDADKKLRDHQLDLYEKFVDKPEEPENA
jgi:hypothetical protein